MSYASVVRANRILSYEIVTDPQMSGKSNSIAFL